MDDRFKKTPFGLIKWHVIFLLIFPLNTFAANTDSPQNYLFGENIGWLNAAVMNVSTSDVSGYLWSENVGWINLSCRNNTTCVKADYGVKNDGKGMLSGYAWGENIGWINFKPTGAGVSIDPNSGTFSGKAWGENVGWLSFNSSAPGGFQLKTAWRGTSNGTPSHGTPLTTQEQVEGESLGPGEETPNGIKKGSAGKEGIFGCQLSKTSPKGSVCGFIPWILTLLFILYPRKVS